MHKERKQSSARIQLWHIGYILREIRHAWLSSQLTEKETCIRRATQQARDYRNQLFSPKVDARTAYWLGADEFVPERGGVLGLPAIAQKQTRHMAFAVVVILWIPVRRPLALVDRAFAWTCSGLCQERPLLGQPSHTRGVGAPRGTWPFSSCFFFSNWKSKYIIKKKFRYGQN
jgi:hypothetical protein